MDLRLIFNEDEENYDKFRPSYPIELFKDIIDYSGISSNNKALEIGVGTGQATIPIIETGTFVTGIELGNNLSEYVGNKFYNHKNFEIINADFMEYQFEPNTFDLIYSATAFHWLPFEKRWEKVKNILSGNGTVALFWNHPFPNREDDISNIINRKIYNKYNLSKKEIVEFSEDDTDKYIGELKNNCFRNIESKLYHRVRTLTSNEYISLLNTYSDHRALPEDIKVSFEIDMKNALDEIGGRINIYDTIDLYLAKK